MFLLCSLYRGVFFRGGGVFNGALTLISFQYIPFLPTNSPFPCDVFHAVVLYFAFLSFVKDNRFLVIKYRINIKKWINKSIKYISTLKIYIEHVNIEIDKLKRRVNVWSHNRIDKHVTVCIWKYCGIYSVESDSPIII